MRLNEIVSFSKESFYNGAVQTEWFYDDDKVGGIAESYVFHGPKYYGVSGADVKAGEHRLIDTASFAKNLTDKLYDKNPDSSFVMTIAGYGTGKSHLAVCLGALFSGKSELSDKIVRNISSVDTDIGKCIEAKNTKRNLVIVLNGMNNFNLDAEILRCTRLSLARSKIDDSMLKRLTKSYDIARHFVDRMFDFSRAEFEKAAINAGIELNGAELKDYLTANVESDSKALRIINTVYEEVNGDKIAWDRGLSAGDILLTLEKELCGDGKPFGKILLIFDEFGRYIEYTAANPAIAGESALQQIFEAIQTADGRIIFVGFIQSELKAYLSRIEKTSNITRYIDRYRTACENLFLSSNFETILANLLKKKQPEFDRTIGAAFERYGAFHTKMRLALSAWDRSAVKKSVWVNEELYNSVILSGCYPLHPITVWLLSNSHQWMQQRSTLAFAAEMFDGISNSEIDGTWLPYIYPYQLIDSGIFNEMLNSEEKGLVPSQYCMLYRDIMVKVGDKLSDTEKTVLKSILVTNIGHMAFRDKDDAIIAIGYCSNLPDNMVRQTLSSLENMHGVTAYDENSKTYDLIAEANGFNEFKRTLIKYRLGVKATINDLDDETLSQLGIFSPAETSFAQNNHITSSEWCFTKTIIDINDITGDYLRLAIRTVNDSYDGEKPRGILIHAYCYEDAEREVIRVSSLCKSLELCKYPVIILFLNDDDGEVLSALTLKKTLQRLSSGDRERFRKYIADQHKIQNNRISRKLTACIAKRLLIGDSGLETYDGRINLLCTRRFAEIFNKPIAFPFDGFEGKSKAQAKGSLISICVSLLNQTITNAQVYSSFTQKDKNRIEAVMSTKSPYSWKVFDNNYQLVEPQNPAVREIIKEVREILENGERINAFALFSKYMSAPYGMNENSLTLLVSYFIAYSGNNYIYTVNGERFSKKHWTDQSGKTKLPEIRRICIQKNSNTDVDEIGDFCKKVISAVDIDAFDDLKKRLDTLTSDETMTDQNKYKIAQAKSHLDEGIRLKNSIYEKVAKIGEIIAELKTKFSIPRTTKALDTLPDLEKISGENPSFIIGSVAEKAVSDARDGLDKLLEQNFQRAVGAMKCTITELSQFRSTYARAAKTLRENGYESYAESVNKRVNEVETELLAKQRYESSLIECEKDLALGSSASGYRECAEIKKKLEGWLGFFSDASDLPESVVKPLKSRIEAVISAKEMKIKDILDNCDNTIASVRKADTIATLNRLDNKLYRMLQTELPESRTTRILITREAIKSATDYISSLPKNIAKLNKIIDEASEEEGICDFAVISSAEALKDKLLREESVWVSRYIDAAERNCQSMTSRECAAWLEATKLIPEWFSTAAKKRYEQVRSLVEKRLHSARVDGLLSMYDALTDDEKLEFRRIIIDKKV